MHSLLILSLNIFPLLSSRLFTLWSESVFVPCSRRSSHLSWLFFYRYPLESNFCLFQFIWLVPTFYDEIQYLSLGSTIPNYDSLHCRCYSQSQSDTLCTAWDLTLSKWQVKPASVCVFCLPAALMLSLSSHTERGEGEGSERERERKDDQRCVTKALLPAWYQTRGFLVERGWAAWQSQQDRMMGTPQVCCTMIV